MRNRETAPATGTQRIEIGDPPLLDMINLILPERLRNHPLVSGKWFYTLPSSVLVKLCSALGPDCFDADILDLDRATSHQADAIKGCVGFHNGLPISDLHLRPLPPINFDDPTVKKCLEEWRAAGYKVPASNGETTENLEALKKPQRAYLGWLLTNRLFLAELQDLRTQFPDAFDGVQSPPAPILFSAISNREDLPQFLEPNRNSTSQAVRDFCQRWRFSRIVGPATYSPISVQFPVALPTRTEIDAQSSGSLLYIPDIAPVPNRDLLERLIQNVVKQTIQREPHLAEWYQLAHAGKLGRKTLNLFAKIYELQHYIRVLYSRHGDRLNRQQSKICNVIGDHVGLNSDQIRLTMKRIRQRLGNGWLAPESLLVLHR